MEELTKDEQHELDRLRGLRVALHDKAQAYIEEHGLDEYLRLPSHQSFKLNYAKFNRLVELEQIDAGINLFDDEETY